MAKYKNAGEPRNSDKSFVDSGCSNHMTLDKSLFSSYNSGHASAVELGSNNTEKIAGNGTVGIDEAELRALLRTNKSSYISLPDTACG